MGLNDMKRISSSSEGSVYQLPSGHWRAQICIWGQRFSSTRRTKVEARDWIREIQEKVSDGMTYEASQTRLSSFMESWLATKRYNIRPATDRQYTDATTIHIIPGLGEVKLIDITPKMVQALIDRLIKWQVGARTVQIVRIVLRSCLQHAVNLGIIRHNPAELVTVPHSSKKQLNVWNEDEAGQFLGSLKGERNEVLYYLALTTGMRQGELLGLKWADVEWRREVVMIRRQAVKIRGGGYGFAEPKSARGWRSVDLGVGSIEKLRKQYELVQLARKIARDNWQENDLVFPTGKGTPQLGTNIDREFHRLMQKAGVRRIRFHDLRHTAASILLSRGIPPVIIAEMLGHTMGVLLSTYAHYIPSDQAQAARVMDEVLTPKFFTKG